MTKKSELIKRINTVKKEKNAVILTHFYQKFNLYRIADFIGDSLELSRKAANTDAERIIFCGVSFMAETAKILSPDKRVFIPDPNSGCLMAEMLEVEQLRKLKAKYPEAAVVCYVNSTAEVKAESDICCTSANAVKVVKSLPQKQIIFVPDKGLGGYVASQLPEKEVICHDGYCPTHWDITARDIAFTKSQHPEALVLVHPECSKEVIEKADYVGSTSGILNFAKESNNKSFIIGSEVGILLYMKDKIPDKKFILPTPNAVCPNMKLNRLEQVLDCLENESNEIFVDPQIAEKALVAIKRMVDLPF